MRHLPKTPNKNSSPMVITAEMSSEPRQPNRFEKQLTAACRFSRQPPLWFGGFLGGLLTYHLAADWQQHFFLTGGSLAGLLSVLRLFSGRGADIALQRIHKIKDVPAARARSMCNSFSGLLLIDKVNKRA